jgi:pyruvoyl-dependent arginine decarboxylase (PvlArgDC)
MSQPLDGGTAFPSITTSARQVENLHTQWYSHVQSVGGMSLRDWFAGQALAGYLSESNSFSDPDKVAEFAYEYADAMLARRNLKGR